MGLGRNRRAHELLGRTCDVVGAVMERPGALLPQRRRHQEQQQGTAPGGCSALGMVTQRAGKRRQMFSSLPLRTSELSSFGSRVWLGNKVSSSREPLIRQEAVPSGPRVGEREREDSARRPWGCNAAAATQGSPCSCTRQHGHPGAPAERALPCPYLGATAPRAV